MNAGTIAGIGSIAGAALVIGLWLYLHDDARKTTTALFLIAGCGIGGLVGAAIDHGFDTASGTAASTTTRLIGFSAGVIVSALCIVLTLEVVFKGILKKTANPKRWHPWLALALPTIAFASGVPILMSIFGAISGALGEAGEAITQLSVG
jgi:hypothetical protein